MTHSFPEDWNYCFEENINDIKGGNIGREDAFGFDPHLKEGTADISEKKIKDQANDDENQIDVMGDLVLFKPKGV